MTAGAGIGQNDRVLVGADATATGSADLRRVSFGECAASSESQPDHGLGHRLDGARISVCPAATHYVDGRIGIRLEAFGLDLDFEAGCRPRSADHRALPDVSATVGAAAPCNRGAPPGRCYWRLPASALAVAKGSFEHQPRLLVRQRHVPSRIAFSTSARTCSRVSAAGRADSVVLAPAGAPCAIWC